MVSVKKFRIRMGTKKVSILVPENAKLAKNVQIIGQHPYLSVLADFDQPAIRTIDLLLLAEGELAIKEEIVIKEKKELIGYGLDDLEEIGHHNGRSILLVR